MNDKALVLVLASMIAAPAVAAPPADVVVERQANMSTVTLLVTRADFASRHSRRALDRRIGEAIESVCGSYATIESYQVPELDVCWGNAHRQVSSQLQIAQARDTALIQLAAR